MNLDNDVSSELVDVEDEESTPVTSTPKNGDANVNPINEQPINQINGMLINIYILCIL